MAASPHAISRGAYRALFQARGFGAGTPDPGDPSRRECRGWYLYGWANSAFYATVVSVFFGPYLNSVARDAADSAGFVHPFGLELRSGTVFPLAIAVSVIAQVVVLPIAGAIAVQTGRKRGLLAGCAGIGSAATMGMFAVAGSRYLLGAGLLIIANVAFGASVVVYNAFLPAIAAPRERDAVSIRGWGIGHLGAGILLALNLAPYTSHDACGLSEGAAVRINLLSAGVWWSAFTAVALRTLPASRGSGGQSAVRAKGRAPSGSVRQAPPPQRHTRTRRERRAACRCASRSTVSTAWTPPTAHRRRSRRRGRRAKSLDLLAAGYLVARLREHPLPPLPIPNGNYAEFTVYSDAPEAEATLAHVAQWAESLPAVQ